MRSLGSHIVCQWYMTRLTVVNMHKVTHGTVDQTYVLKV